MKRRLTSVIVALTLLVAGCSHTGIPAVDRLFMSDAEKKVSDTNSEAEKAIALVRARPEVASWLARTGATAKVTAEGTGAKKWLVHAYDEVPGTNKVEPHIGTFNWYRVDLDKNEAVPEFK